jgi:uncharacterized protein YxeA
MHTLGTKMKTALAVLLLVILTIVLGTMLVEKKEQNLEAPRWANQESHTNPNGYGRTPEESQAQAHKEELERTRWMAEHSN